MYLYHRRFFCHGFKQHSGEITVCLEARVGSVIWVLCSSLKQLKSGQRLINSNLTHVLSVGERDFTACSKICIILPSQEAHTTKRCLWFCYSVVVRDPLKTAAIVKVFYCAPNESKTNQVLAGDECGLPKSGVNTVSELVPTGRGSEWIQWLKDIVWSLTLSSHQKSQLWHIQ